MDMAVVQCIVIAVAWFGGSFLTGITGIGGAMVAIPLMALVLDMNEVILTSCLCGTAVAIMLGVYFCKYANRREIIPLFLGCVPGAFAGLYIIMYVPVLYIQLGMGLMIFFAALRQLFERQDTTRITRYYPWAVACGFAGGLAQTATSVGGPPIALYASLRRWDKDMVRGTLGVYYIVSALFTNVVQGGSGLYTEHMWILSIWGAIGSFLGFIVSIPVGRAIPQNVFRKCVLWLLLASGLSLIIGPFV